MTPLDLDLETAPKFKRVFEEAPTGMALCDNCGYFVRANKRYCDMLGYAEEELVGVSYIDITYFEDISRDSHLVQDIIDGKIDSYVIEKRYVRKDGTLVWARLWASGMRDEAGKLEFFIAQTEDITHQKEMEEELQLVQTRLRELSKKYEILGD